MSQVFGFALQRVALFVMLYSVDEGVCVCVCLGYERGERVTRRGREEWEG